MSYHGHPVVDMDTHIREYDDLDRTYKEYIDPGYREAYGQLSQAVASRREAGESTALFMHPRAIVEPSDESRPLGVYDAFGVDVDRPRHQPESRGPKKEPISRNVHWDPSIRLTDMDRAGVDASVMFPSHAASFCTLRDVGFESALHHA